MALLLFVFFTPFAGDAKCHVCYSLRYKKKL